MKLTSLIPLLLIVLAVWMLSRRVSQDPCRPAGHDEYMHSEYGSLWAFVKAEEKIDAFLLELENR